MEKQLTNIKQNEAVRISALSIGVNIALSAVKLAAGIIGKSTAMISDAVHSATDVFSTVIVIIGVKLAGKSADDEHPYGHERMECAAAIILAMTLALVGLGIGISAVKTLIGGDSDITIPGILPLIAAPVSIAAKEWLFRITRRAARRLNSAALMADAWHHRSDALSSVGSFIGIFFARLGFPLADSAAGAIISVCIIKAAYDIFKDGLDKMVDRRADSQTESEIREAALNVSGVKGIDDLKTRLFGDKIYVDMEILVDGNLSLFEAHEIAENVHKSIESDFPICKHCMIHTNPFTS